MTKTITDPSTPEEWFAVARERGIDAEAMLPKRATSVGPFYMAGYAIECAIKAYLQQKGKPRPSHGREGHNLRGLWRSAGFHLVDIKAGTYFFDNWTTDLRYQASNVLPDKDSQELVRAAMGLVKWITTRVRESRRHK